MSPPLLDFFNCVALVSLNFLCNYILEVRQAAGWEGETGCMEASESVF
jgi:hypothetical protein